MDADAVLRSWLHRSGEFSPEYYAYYGPNETSETIRSYLDRTVGPDASVLELGCSAGRHLAHLHENGFTDLSGIDVNEDAEAVMADSYPDLAEAGTFYFDSIESVVTEFADRAFDAVFSVQTLQHIHPDNAWVFPEIARITGDVLITVEQDGTASTDPSVTYINDEFPLYRRPWRPIFEEEGFEHRESIEFDRDALHAFRRRDR